MYNVGPYANKKLRTRLNVIAPHLDAYYSNYSNQMLAPLLALFLGLIWPSSSLRARRLCEDPALFASDLLFPASQTFLIFLYKDFVSFLIFLELPY